MSKLYDESHRTLQRRFDTERLADRIEQRLCRAQLSAGDQAFIAGRDLFFLATVDSAGRPTCSYKGGDPGFVHSPDEHTLVFPNYDGNGMYLSMGNVAATSQVGLLFIDFEHPQRLRVQGSASIVPADALEPGYPGAQFLVRVEVQQVFPNCPRYVHRMRKIAPSEFVPHAGEISPVPKWKRMDWACDVLPAGDPARNPPKSG
ncbi:MAG TPA: pyridoxamine 5'-phosphate oxidase family protein [Steroidobacteraceae bacterium]|nr:pyridoxamine 5'-phosphate oxidase family protein [Steroidobacteraceae bacterium]